VRIPIYQVDAFTSKVFSGNPAAVCLLNDWISDSDSGKIADVDTEPKYPADKGFGFFLCWQMLGYFWIFEAWRAHV